MSYSPTLVNPKTAQQSTYSFMPDQRLLLPDGEYLLKQGGGRDPIYYLYNSDDKFTGYWVWLEIFDKKNQLIEIDFTKPQIVNALNGKESVKVKKGQKAVIDRFHQLTSVYSKKNEQQVIIERYPIYQPSEQPIAQSTGTIVDKDSNKPIKGVTVQRKTD
jgi:hypothetical protein